MIKFPIGIGNCSLTYLYILGAALLGLFQDYLISLDDIKSGMNYNIFHIKTVLKQHKLIRVLYGYISFIIFGIIFYYISEYLKDNKKSKSKKSTLQQQFIVNKTNFTSKIKKELIIICGLYSLNKVFRKIASFFKVSDLDFWIFNIVFISIFMYYYFRINIYNHHKYSLIFIFFTNLCLLFIAASIKKNKEPTIFNKHTWKCFFIILMYIIFSLVSSFSKVASKKLMDINYVSPYKLIFFIGIFGFFFTLISLIFTSIINCGANSKYCKIQNSVIKNNSTSTYLDNIPLYFSEMKNIYNNKDYKAFYIEIFVVIPLYSLANFGEFAFEIVIILYLNPNYILISDCIYFGTTKLIEYIFKGDYAPKKFLVEYIAESLTLIGYTIYLEIIELRFCGLDNDLKKNITERSIKESLVQEIDFDINERIDDNEYDRPDIYITDGKNIFERNQSVELGMMIYS